MSCGGESRQGGGEGLEAAVVRLMMARDSLGLFEDVRTLQDRCEGSRRFERCASDVSCPAKMFIEGAST